MTDDVINPENSRYFNYLRRYSLNRWTIGVSTSCAGTQIQLSRVLEERFKARDLRCPQAALHCASSLSKWQSGVLEERFISMSARLSPGCSPMCQNPPLYLSHLKMLFLAFQISQIKTIQLLTSCYYYLSITFTMQQTENICLWSYNE